MEIRNVISYAFLLSLFLLFCNGAKINTPRVLLPWFENKIVKFTFEIHDAGCYTWSLSRDDIIDLEPLYEDTWGHCSRSARVSVSKTCAPPGSVIILAEEVNTGEILRGDVDVDKIRSLKVMSTTRTVYLEEAPEAFEVVAYDEQGNKFSTLEGISFDWSIENLGNNIGEELLITLVRWRDTDYEAPKGVAELEAQGFRSHSVLLYGQAIGQSKVQVCLGDICTDFQLQVVASVVLTPAIAMIAPGDTLKYKVVRVRAGRLNIQDIHETLYYLKVPDAKIALLEDAVSLVRGKNLGTTTLQLMSGITEVATSILTVVEPHSIRVTLRPPNLLIKGEVFIIHSAVLDINGHLLTAGDEILIRLSVEGEANVDLISSTENGTITNAIASNVGGFTVKAQLHSIAGKIVTRKVEGQTSAEVIAPLEVVPPELFVAWTDTNQQIPLHHRGGGNEDVIWSESETEKLGVLSLAQNGVVTVRGIGDLEVKVQLEKYSHVKAFGRVWSLPPEYIQVSSSGSARVGRPHLLHVALTATHPTTGEFYNFHRCDCASFTVTLLEGPEPQNITAATWVEPAEGACCVLQASYAVRGVSSVRVRRGRAGDVARVAVRAAPALLWPARAAALLHATLPVLAEGESLSPSVSDARIADLSPRDGVPPHRHPDVQLFTFKCKRKGEVRLEVTSHTDTEAESVELESACAPFVSRIRLEPPDMSNCSGGPKVWLQPGQEVSIKVTLLDSIGRELLDERGPKVSWEVEPYHAGIEVKSPDRLLVETHPDFVPVPVPYKYYQLVVADNKAIGWTGTLKASIPEATVSIQAKVVAPLKCNPMKVSAAWEGDVLNNIVSVTGGSGRYSVEPPPGTTGAVDGGALAVAAPGPGTYDVVVADTCMPGEKSVVEVHIEEILSVEVATSRAVGVGACVPISALVKGVSHRYLTTNRDPQWRTSGDVVVKDGTLCGVKEGSGRVKAAQGNVWSPELEVIVFPPLAILPAAARVPPAARLQLRHHGGPPSHLAQLHYSTVTGHDHVEVTPAGSVHGVSLGKARVKLVALDIENIEMASAQSEVEVIPISGLRLRAATQSVVVGCPCPVWVEAGGLSPATLAALQPSPRVTFTLRDATVARLYTGHVDDMLERSVAEGLSVRVVPLKPGVITIDVRVRNMGQVAETRSWDSSIEVLGISEVRMSIEGATRELGPGDRLAVAVGSNIRLKSLPRGVWKAYEDGAFELTPSGEIKAQQPGHGVVVAQHKDDRNNIYRETAVHVQVSEPAYCTAEGGAEPGAVRVVLRDAAGRALLAPHANVSVHSPTPHALHTPPDSVHGPEVVLSNIEAGGAFVTFQAKSGGAGVLVTDEVWVAGTDALSDIIIVSGGMGVCVDGTGWRAPAGVALAAGSGATLALLTRDAPARHTLRQDRTHLVKTLHQLNLEKFQFTPGEWPAALVPLSLTPAGAGGGAGAGAGAGAARALLCTEQQRYALEGVALQLPFVCRTKPPHAAEPVIDIIHDEIGCKIIPATIPVEASEIEVCAEFGVHRACTRTMLLPEVRVSNAKVSLVRPPAVFTVVGHPHAMKLVKLTASPGLKLDLVGKPGEMLVTVTNEATACGLGWVTVTSKLTAQEIRVDVERECEIACGSLLGALLSLLTPYLSTIVTVAGVAAAYLFIQSRAQRKARIVLPQEPAQTVLPPRDASPPLNRSRTWSRSPYASSGPSVPVYGDASILPDNSFSPTSTRTHSRFL